MNKQADIVNLTSGTVQVSLYAAYQIAKKTGIPIAQVLAGLKAAFGTINFNNTVSTGDAVKAIFKVLSGSANLSKNYEVEYIEKLAQDIYSAFTGGDMSGFGALWPEILQLFHGKLAGTADQVDAVADQALIEQGLVTLLTFGIAQAPSAPEGGTNTGAADILKDVLAGIDAGFAAVDLTVEPTLNDMIHGGLYLVLDSIADLWTNLTFGKIVGAFEKLYNIYSGTGGTFVKDMKLLFAGISVKHTLHTLALAKAA